MIYSKMKQITFRHRPFSDLRWISSSKHALISGSNCHQNKTPTVPEMGLLQCSVCLGSCSHHTCSPHPFPLAGSAPRRDQECGKGLSNLDSAWLIFAQQENCASYATGKQRNMVWWLRFSRIKGLSWWFRLWPLGQVLGQLRPLHITSISPSLMR